MTRTQQSIVNQALEYEHLLTDWESEFVNNLAEHFEDRELSEKQNEIVNRISTKIASTR